MAGRPVGGRRVLTFAVIWWSVFTALGAAALGALLGGLLWVKIKPGDGLKAMVAKSRSGC